MSRFAYRSSPLYQSIIEHFRTTADGWSARRAPRQCRREEETRRILYDGARLSGVANCSDLHACEDVATSLDEMCGEGSARETTGLPIGPGSGPQRDVVKVWEECRFKVLVATVSWFRQ